MNQDDDIIRMAREACPYTTDEMRGAFYEGFLKGAAAEREWQGLMDEEIYEMDDLTDEPSWEQILRFVRAVEAKLKEKNT